MKLELPVSQYKDLLTTSQENNFEVEQPEPVWTPPTEPVDERTQRVENRQHFKNLEEEKLQEDNLHAETELPSGIGVQAKPMMRNRKIQIRRKTDLELKLMAEVKLLKENFSIVKDANKALKKETKRLKSKKHEKEIVRNRLSKVKNLSAGQIKLLVNDQKYVWNTTADIARCAVLYSINKSAYNYQRSISPKGWMASPSAINRWLSEFQVKPGFQENAINIIKKMKQTPGHQKDLLFHHTSLVFDEIHIRDDSVQMDQKTQKVYGPHKKLQLVMIRGLGSK